MRVHPSLAWILALGLAGCTASPDRAAAPTPTVSPAPAPPSGAADVGIAAAAQAFLGTLDARQRDAVLFDRGDRAQKQRWSNLPAGLYERRGVRTGDLDRPQLDAFLALMRATLSAEGYERVVAQWSADDAMPAGGGRITYGREHYWIALIGEPSATEPWQWQFGGHHVTVNATIRGDRLSLTPSFLGAQPASYPAGGTTVRPLGDIVDRAFALVNSFDANARQRAVLGGTPVDLVLGAGQDCRRIPAEGLPGSAMTTAQRAAFLDLLDRYGGLGTERLNAARRAQLRDDLPDTHFAWYGPTAAGSAAYFRITGPHVVVEYAPQAMGGDATNHVHGIYRDPTDDYGGTVC
ncbi:hypothetical protein Val02_03990 [Virgisporangium aliadipatigenens]|uniref:DUF3500 domain-containing protein n=1 Tax=Virgisporangium aliadipatigenens TaxID=741659 RepID=A0A8J4DNF1_9ACTN|nr:DUF3500 domain-containing protein [Virgisporangium aliadipatigenens]GIJ43513.1 hypothetical protein Val02_03990 [Virgisporangium aliadipatigenens]